MAPTSLAVPAMLLAILAFGGCSSASSSGSNCGTGLPQCPATADGIILRVNSGSDGGAVTGVQATLSGPAMVTMYCELDLGQSQCTWPSGSVTAGSYTLQVTAPGFRTASVSATVTVPPAECGCVIASMKPASVTLDPS